MQNLIELLKLGLFCVYFTYYAFRIYINHQFLQVNGAIIAKNIQFFGPAYIKIFQWIAQKVPSLSELKRLQYDTEQYLPVETVKQYVAPHLDCISEIKPLASGTIASVYHVVANEIGYAVKIKHPNIDNILKIQLKLLEFITYYISIFVSFLRLTDFKVIIETLNKQTDLIIEAQNLRKFREICHELINNKYFSTPEIIYNDSDIIIMTYLKDYQVVTNSNAPDHITHKTKQMITQIMLYTQYGHGFIHADLHDGNVMFNENGDLAIIDFGACEYISKETYMYGMLFIVAIYQSNKGDFVKYLKKIIVPTTKNLDEFAILFFNTLKSFKTIDALEDLLNVFFNAIIQYEIKLLPEILSFLVSTVIAEKNNKENNYFVLACEEMIRDPLWCQYGVGYKIQRSLHLDNFFKKLH